MKNKDLYEKFHQQTKIHKQLINENSFTQGHILKIINKYIKKNDQILDIGCGTGSLCFYYANQNHQVTGVDVSKRAIQSCKANSEALGVSHKCNFVQSSLEEYGSNIKFEIVTCLEVIEHIKVDIKAMSKITSMVKKNGILILSTPSLSAPLYKIGFLHGFDKRVGHLRRYDFQTLNRVVSTQNIKVLQTIPTEGLIRNFIFTSTIGSKIILRFINRSFFLQKLVTSIDNVTIKFFGHSDIIIVLRVLS